MKNYNRAPGITALTLTAILSLGVGACASVNEQPPGPDVSADKTAPPKTSLNQDNCQGVVTGLSYMEYDSEGEVYRIAAIEGGECAPLYKSTQTEIRDALGSISVGDKVIGPCTFEENGKYVSVYTFDADTAYAGDMPTAEGLVADMNSHIIQVTLCDSKTPKDGFKKPR